jgi:hypothetical protein
MTLGRYGLVPDLGRRVWAKCKLWTIYCLEAWLVLGTLLFCTPSYSGQPFTLICRGTLRSVQVMNPGFHAGPDEGPEPLVTVFTLDLDSGTWYEMCEGGSCPHSGALRSTNSKLFLDRTPFCTNGVTEPTEVDRVSGALHSSVQCPSRTQTDTLIIDQQCQRAQLVMPPPRQF